MSDTPAPVPVPGEVAFEAPDSPVAIRAFRVWAVARRDGETLLESTAAGFWSGMPAWSPHVRFEARCLARRRCPGAPTIGRHHGCGIYGLSSRDAALEWARHIGRVRSNVVLGEVWLWGAVVEAERGWRAQYAYPASVLTVISSRRASAIDVLGLAASYGIEAA